MTVITLLVLRETYHPVLLKRRLSRLRSQTGNQSLRIAGSTDSSRLDDFISALGRPLKMLIFSPVVLLPCLGVAVVTGMLYLLISTLAIVFQEQYHLSTGSSGLAYLGLNIGLIFALFVFAATSDRAYKKFAKNGPVQPEIRLVPVSLAAPLCCTGLVLYGWSAEKEVHWIVSL